MPRPGPPAADPTRHVFVSYASADRERVLPVAAALERAGVRVWIDRAGIPGGASYGPVIARAIKDSGALVLCRLGAAFASRNVRQEGTLAWKHGRPVLPLLLEPVAIPEDLEYWLEGSQWVELLDRPEAAWLPDVVGALRRHGMGVDAAGAEPSAAPKAARVSLPTPLTLLLGRDGVGPA